MLELALHADDRNPVAIREITAQHGIPQPFLVQILQQLKSAGLVTSTRGSQGGYRLAMRPDKITLLDIADKVGSNEAGCSAEDEQTAAALALRSIWDAASERYRDHLAATRLSDLSERCRDADDAMFYI